GHGCSAAALGSLRLGGERRITAVLQGGTRWSRVFLLRGPPSAALVPGEPGEAQARNNRAGRRCPPARSIDLSSMISVSPTPHRSTCQHMSLACDVALVFRMSDLLRVVLRPRSDVSARVSC